MKNLYQPSTLVEEEKITRKVQKPPTRGSINRSVIIKAVRSIAKENIPFEEVTARPVLVFEEPVTTYSVEEVDDAIKTVLHKNGNGNKS